MKIKRGYTIKEEDESLHESSDEPKVTVPKRINQNKVGKSHQAIDTDFGDGLFSNGGDQLTAKGAPTFEFDNAESPEQMLTNTAKKQINFSPDLE